MRNFFIKKWKYLILRQNVDHLNRNTSISFQNLKIYCQICIYSRKTRNNLNNLPRRDTYNITNKMVISRNNAKTND